MRQKKIPFKLMLTPADHQWLCSEAEARDVSRTRLLLMALDQYRAREELATTLRRVIREELDRTDSRRL
jgi:hypothetical protein